MPSFTCARSISQLARRFLPLCALAVCAGPSSAQGVNVLTFHGAPDRIGWNSRETRLTPATVNAAGFGKVWETVLDGQIYGSPLHVSGLRIAGKRRDVVYTATENNSVYALDAATGQILWGPRTLAPSLNEAQFNDCNNIHPLHGITSTPVIDLPGRSIYVCGVTQPGIRQVYRVWALDLLTGEIKVGWPVTVKARYRGCDFDAGQLTQRGALNLVNGWVYMTFGSRCDIGEWHGWVIGVNTRDPHAPLRAFCPAPTVDGGGMWGAAGVAADSKGNLYAVTGNGDYDLDKGGDNICESVLKLQPDGDKLDFRRTPEGNYVAPDWKQLDESDVDMGGSSAIVLPDQPGTAAPHLLVTCGKDGQVYVINRDRPGGVGGHVLRQRLFGDPKESFHSNIKTTPAYFDSGDSRFVYVTGNETGPNGEAGIVALRVEATGGKTALTEAWTLKRALRAPGAPAVSSDGGRNGIVWVIESNKDDGDLGPPGVLHAFDAVTGTELYNSSQDPTRDTLTDARKFSSPTIANGRVFVGTRGVVAYGLLGGR